jgi:hypothetical protein
MQIFIVLVVAVSIFLLLIKLIGSLTGRLSERMVTNFFRSAEALLERNRLPEPWKEEVARMAARGTVRHRVIYLVRWDEAAKPYLMKKINEVHKFFEKCPFVENPESRELLLKRLDAVMERWESTDAQSILASYDVALDAR